MNGQSIPGRHDAHTVDREDLRHLDELVVPFQRGLVSGQEEVELWFGVDLLPVRDLHIVVQEPIVFVLPQSPEVGVVHLRLVTSSKLDEKGDGHALPDVEDVLVLAPVGAGLPLQRVAVQVQDVSLIEGLHEALTHAPEGGVVQVGMVSDHAHQSLARLLDLPLGEAQELHVIVLKPLGVFLPQGFPVHLLVVFDQPQNPLPSVGRMTRIGWIAQDDQDGALLLDLARQAGLLGQRGHAGQVRLFQLLHLQGVGQVELKALIVTQTVPQLLQEEGHLEVPHGVGGHHQLEGVEVLQDVIADELLPAARAVFALELPHRLLAGSGDEGHGPRRRVEQSDPLGGQAVAATELLPQQLVERADDVGDHWLRCVVDPAPLALLGVVLGQKGLVEVDDGVAALALAVEAVEDAARVGHGQHLGDVIHDPFELLGQIAQRDELEHIPQDADGSGDAVVGHAAVEPVPGPGAGGEEAVGDRLRVEVGEGLQGEIGDQVRLESLVEPPQDALLFAQLVGHHVAEKAGAFGQLDRQRLRRV